MLGSAQPTEKRNTNGTDGNSDGNSDGIWTEFRRNEKRKKNGISTFLKTHKFPVFFLCAMVRGRGRRYVREVLELVPSTTLVYLRLSSAEVSGKSIPMQHVDVVIDVKVGLLEKDNELGTKLGHP